MGARKKIVLWLALIVALVGLGLWCFSRYAGDWRFFVLFNLSFLGLVALAFPRPRSFAYTLLSLFLFLGFWAKFIVHTLSDAPYLEPIGDFDGSPHAWDRALLVSSMAAVGVMLGRSVHLASSPWLTGPGSVFTPPPPWYPRLRNAVWTASLLLVLAVNGLNFEYAFYQIGVNTSLLLPYRLHVLAAWLVNIGFALWFGSLLWWEACHQRALKSWFFALPLLEALLASVSALSRSIFVLRALPYMLTLAESYRTLWPDIRKRGLALLILSGMAGVLLNLFAVTWLRIQLYPPTHTLVLKDSSVVGAFERVPEGQQVDPAELERVRRLTIVGAVDQVARLSVDRWVGIEGVLAVSSYPDLGIPLFQKAWTEDPKRGLRGTYQVISKAPYNESRNFTFLTLPGLAAVLFYSGSLLVVAIGAALISIIAIGTELWALKATGNVFVAGIVGSAVANVICQLNYPYLLLVFLIQLHLAILFLYAIKRVPYAGNWNTPTPASGST